MNLLIDILKTPSVSGYESGLKNVILDKFKEYGLITAVSPLGNISGKRMGTFPYTILIDAHYDQIGLIVKKIEENGMIRAQNVGGVDPRVLFNLPLKIFGNEIVKAVVATKPPHLQKTKNKNKIPKISEFLIDTGLSKKELSSKIRIGDPIFFDVEPEIMGNYISSPAIDNKGGLWVLLKLAQFLKSYKAVPSVILRATVQEEVGCRGAANRVDDLYDLAVVIDATFATQHLADDDHTFPIVGGLTIMYGPNYSKKINEKFENVASNNHIKFQREVEESVYGTNAYRYSVSGNHATCGISYPIFNMHTPNEVVAIPTLLSIVELLTNFIKKFGGNK